MVDARSQLMALLAEDAASATHRRQTTFETQNGPLPHPLVLFGSGNLGRKTLHGLRRAGLQPVAFADNNPAWWGTQHQGIPILSPADAVLEYPDATFVITIWGAGQKHRTADIHRQLLTLGCARIASFASLFWRYPDIFLPYLAIDVPQKVLAQRQAVIDAFDSLVDAQSQHEYVAQLRWRLWLDFDGLPNPDSSPQYWPRDLLSPVSGECFVDCGAFDGDTIAQLQQHHPGIDRIVAFEPDPGNFIKLRKFVESLPQNFQQRITLRQEATADSRKTVRFNAAGTGASAIGQGDLEVQCATLDETLESLTPTYIKMDVEGAEIETLRGARTIIETHHPVLAVCAYHEQDHLWKVPLLIRSLSPQYRLHFRAHNQEGFDLVCYALPPMRRT